MKVRGICFSPYMDMQISGGMKQAYVDYAQSVIVSKQVETFNNPHFGEIRTAVDDFGEPWFCLADVCRILELRVDGVMPRLREGGYNRIVVTDALGRNQETTFVNEQNLYRVIMRSDKPKAEPFQDWVCGEILPSIRKTGQYSVKPLTQGQMLVQMAQAYEAQERMLLEQQEKQRVMETQIHRLECATDVNYGFMAVLGYAKLHGIAVTRKLAATIGKAVSKYCRDNNIKFGSQKHPIFGNVNIYPDHALQAVFPKFFPNRNF